MFCSRGSFYRNVRCLIKTFIWCVLLFFTYVMYDLNVEFQRELMKKDAELEKIRKEINWPIWSRAIDFEGFDNNTGNENGCYVVPNYIHFVKFNQMQFTFVEMLCVLAAYRKQRPEKLFIHTNVAEFRGKYWDILMTVHGFTNVLYLNFINLPSEIFGQRISAKFLMQHSSDITRIQMLMQFGGIFLENDMFLIKSLDDLRRYETVLGWNPGKPMANQIIIAHKDSRFLKEYLFSYRNRYLGDVWNYNAAVKPTNEILAKKPYLIHRVEEHLGVYNRMRNIFMMNWRKWREYYSLRLFVDHQYFLRTVNGSIKYPVVFDDFNIKNYKGISFYEMVKEIYDFDRQAPF